MLRDAVAMRCWARRRRGPYKSQRNFSSVELWSYSGLAPVPIRGRHDEAVVPIRGILNISKLKRIFVNHTVDDSGSGVVKWKFAVASLCRPFSVACTELECSFIYTSLWVPMAFCEYWSTEMEPNSLLSLFHVTFDATSCNYRVPADAPYSQSWQAVLLENLKLIARPQSEPRKPQKAAPALPRSLSVKLFLNKRTRRMKRQ